MMGQELQLIAPCHEALHAYAAALRTGWSPYASRDVSGEHLAAIEADPEAFLVDLVRIGGMIAEPDGSMRPKLPQIIRWMWDGEFVGAINLRWQPETDDLPPYVSGHIGYIVVPWKRRRGYATEALRMMLTEARAIGLGTVEITTDDTNEASQKVIERCGGIHFDTRDNPFGPVPKRHYRIGLGA